MAGFIPEDKISEIQNSVDIVDIISEAVLLKQSGRNYTGLCPFHSEKTPSFSVSREKQIFYCFGCGVGGNAFSFLMKHDGLTFVEAVKKLARRAGIEIPDHNMNPEIKKRIDEKEILFSVNKDAAIFFQNSLGAASGRKAFKYLENRGIEKDVMDLFQMGFAPRGWDNLVRYFSKKTSRMNNVEKAGLIVSRQSGTGYYDRFRERIIFPIFNAQNRVIGFGGRVMDDSLPKYLNTPETLVFNKSKNLYGLNLTKPACREASAAFLVEGYFDLIALYQHGIKNVVATLGTALTLDHIRILKGLVNKVVLVFDSDEAGAKAASRSIPLFGQENVEVRVMVLPEGYDPDSFVFKFGAEAFYKIADKALGVMSYLMETAVSKHGRGAEGKLAIISQMKGPLTAIEDPVARSVYIKELSERIGVEQGVVLESIRKESFRGRKKYRFSKSSGDEKPSTQPAQSPAEETTVCRSGHKTESKLISMMLQSPEMISEIMASGALEFFENENLKAIGKAIVSLHKNKRSDFIDPSDLLPCLDSEIQRSMAASLAMDDEDCWSESQSRKRQLIFQFLEYTKKTRENHLIEKIKEAEAKNDIVLLSKLLQEQQKLALASQEQKLALLKKSSNMTIFE